MVLGERIVRVLICGTNAFASVAVRALGKNLNLDIHHVYDDRQAIRSYQNIHPDLILISDRMSGCVPLCAFVRKLESSRHTGIIFFCGDAKRYRKHVVEYFEHGADDVANLKAAEEELHSRILAVTRFKVMNDELRQANHRLQKLSLTDELTGLSNMRAFEGRYSRAISDCASGKKPLAVLMFDLDNFKVVNDSADHLMGSYVISEAGRLIGEAANVSQAECVARFGGDEYVIFTNDPDVETAVGRAEKIRIAIEAREFVRDGRRIRITISGGVLWCEAGYRGKAEEPIKQADVMLYHSKNSGRNKISAATLNTNGELTECQSAEILCTYSANTKLAS